MQIESHLRKLRVTNKISNNEIKLFFQNINHFLDGSDEALVRLLYALPTYKEGLNPLAFGLFS